MSDVMTIVAIPQVRCDANRLWIKEPDGEEQECLRPPKYGMGSERPAANWYIDACSFSPVVNRFVAFDGSSLYVWSRDARFIDQASLCMDKAGGSMVNHVALGEKCLALGWTAIQESARRFGPSVSFYVFGDYGWRHVAEKGTGFLWWDRITGVEVVGPRSFLVKGMIRPAAGDREGESKELCINLDH